MCTITLVSGSAEPTPRKDGRLSLVTRSLALAPLSMLIPVRVG